jgi:hypothetical protein
MASIVKVNDVAGNEYEIEGCDTIKTLRRKTSEAIFENNLLSQWTNHLMFLQEGGIECDDPDMLIEDGMNEFTVIVIPNELAANFANARRALRRDELDKLLQSIHDKEDYELIITQYQESFKELCEIMKEQDDYKVKNDYLFPYMRMGTCHQQFIHARHRLAETKHRWMREARIKELEDSCHA